MLLRVGWQCLEGCQVAPGRPRIYQGPAGLIVELAAQIQSFSVTQVANQHASALEGNSVFQRCCWAVSGFVTRLATTVTAVGCPGWTSSRWWGPLLLAPSWRQGQPPGNFSRRILPCRPPGSSPTLIAVPMNLPCQAESFTISFSSTHSRALGKTAPHYAS